MVIHSDFTDFTIFLYLHIAHADGSFHGQEENIIKEKMRKILPENTDVDKKFEACLDDYRAVKKEEIPIIMRHTFEHFKGVKFSIKYKVYTDLYDIINADGKVDESEKSTLDLLRSLIDLGIPQQSEN